MKMSERLKLAHTALEHANTFFANLVCADEEQRQWANAVQEHIQRARFDSRVEPFEATVVEKGSCELREPDWYDGMGIEDYGGILCD